MKHKLTKDQARKYIEECFTIGIHSDKVDQKLLQECMDYFMKDYVQIKTVFDNRL
ncbi:hypothetical protein VP277E431_P0256 [Vibrio phage 277E43-1]|nr:hypothetical protein VP277E431_P0256 [Vibrio phage 277E43-1]